MHCSNAPFQDDNEGLLYNNIYKIMLTFEIHSCFILILVSIQVSELSVSFPVQFPVFPDLHYSFAR